VHHPERVTGGPVRITQARYHAPQATTSNGNEAAPALGPRVLARARGGGRDWVAGRDDRCDRQGRPCDLAVGLPQRATGDRPTGEAGGESLHTPHACCTHRQRPDQREEASGV